MHEPAVLYMKQAQYDKAELLLLEVVTDRIQKPGPQHPHTIESIKNLIELYEALNKPDEATYRLAKLPQVETAEE